MKKKYVKRIGILGLLLTLVGCSAGKNKTNIEMIQGMMEQKNLKAQGYDRFRNTPNMMTPPEGTVPQGMKPYPYAGKPLDAEARLVNPYAHDSKRSLELGKQRYEIYCSVCHGVGGKGDGPVSSYMSLRPPSLLSDKVRGFKDGRIFHIITDGQGLMNSYATQVFKEEDRWAIVNYVRALQK